VRSDSSRGESRQAGLTKLSLFALFIVASVGCRAPTPERIERDKPPTTTPAPTPPSPPDDAERVKALVKQHGDACVHNKVDRCGDLLFMACDQAVDGPSFYVRVSTGQDISRCGGACWHPRGEQEKACHTMCPPAEWNCSGR
jgi:hypothetical protein